MIDDDDLNWRFHLQAQADVTSRRQALEAGWSPKGD
jgi:hypothetical protein